MPTLPHPTTASWILDAGVRCDYGSCKAHAEALSILVIGTWMEARPMCSKHSSLTARIHGGGCHTVTPS